MNCSRADILSRSEAAVWEALLPAGAHPDLPGISLREFERFLKEFRARAPTPLRLALRAALWTAVWVAPLLCGRLRPFLFMTVEERGLALAAMGRSRFYLIRQMLLVLKLVAGLHYGADPRVRKILGIP